MTTNWGDVSTEELKRRFGTQYKTPGKRNRPGPSNRRKGPGPVDKAIQQWGQRRSDRRDAFKQQQAIRDEASRQWREGNRNWLMYGNREGIKPERSQSNRQRQSIARQDTRAGKAEYQRRLRELDQQASTQLGDNTKSGDIQSKETNVTAIQHAANNPYPGKLMPSNPPLRIGDKGFDASGIDEETQKGVIERRERISGNPNRHFDPKTGKPKSTGKSNTSASTSAKTGPTASQTLGAISSALNTLDMLTGGQDEIAWMGSGWGGVGYGGGSGYVGQVMAFKLWEGLPPKSNRKTTAKGKYANLEEYKKAWAAWRKKHTKPNGIVPREAMKSFYKKYGEHFDKEGRKYRPGYGEREINGKTFKTAGKELTTSTDSGILRRADREQVLTYMFGGDELSITEAAKRAVKSGYDDYSAHHKFGSAEFEPFIDDIIEGLRAPKTSALHQQAMEKLEAGKAYFRNSKYFAGNVEQNYKMLTDLQHKKSKNPKNLHQLLYEHGVTANLGKSPWYQKSVLEDLAALRGTDGIYGQSTVDYLQSLPWSKEESLSYTRQLPGTPGKKHLRGKPYKTLKTGVDAVPDPNKWSRWHAMELWMDQSGGLRDELTTIARKSAPDLTRTAAQRLKDSVSDVPIGQTLQKQHGLIASGAEKFRGGDTMALAFQSDDALTAAARQVGHGAELVLDDVRKFGNAQGAKRAAVMAGRWGMVNPAMLGTSSVLGAYALKERQKEVAANPNDPYLRFQLMLDTAALTGDVVGTAASPFALTGLGALAPIAAEITSNVAGSASLVMDFDRWIKTDEGKKQAMDTWTSIYNRGARQLYRGVKSLF